MDKLKTINKDMTHSESEHTTGGTRTLYSCPDKCMRNEQFIFRKFARERSKALK